MPYYIDESSFVVADVGSFATRVGLSGMELPSGSFPSSVGVIENDTLNSTSKSNKNTLTSSTNEKSYHFDVENFREHMGIENPYDNNGLITNWDVLEKIYEYSYSKYLKCKSNERPIIIAEKSNNNTQQLMKNREQLCELMFETFEVPGFYIGNDATLALYANGYTSGTVVDIGHSGSTITPILNGYADTECVEFENAQDAIEKINWLLKNPKKLIEIAENGRKKTLEFFSYKNRCEIISKILNDKLC